MTSAELQAKLAGVPRAELQAYADKMCETEGGEWCDTKKSKTINVVLCALALAAFAILAYYSFINK